MRAISIRQPWAWLIVNGHKDIENRDWSTTYRGPVLVHASKTLTQKHHRELTAQLLEQFGIQIPAFDELLRGGIVGQVDITGCVRTSESPWFTGTAEGGYGFTLANPRPLTFYPCSGSLSWFDVPARALNLEPAV